MRPVGLTLLLALALAGCATNRFETPLAGLDLSDPKTIAQLQNGLSKEDAGALGVYALLHWPGSRAFCGDALVDANGRMPATLGEAIALTRVREQADAAARLARARPRPAGEILLEERDLAVRRRDSLLERLNIAKMQPSSSQRQKELDLIESDLLDANSQLQLINRKLEFRN